jgi:lipopolysaccharide assembly protein A
MKRQWSLILAIIFAIIIAIFAVINVEPVEVDYLFGKAEWPLVLIILGSVFMGGFIIASAGVVRILAIHRKLKVAEKENMKLKTELETLKNEKEKTVTDTVNKKEEIDQEPTTGV